MTPMSREQIFNHIVMQQPRLRAYIQSLVTDWHATEDVLQQTNMALLKKIEEAGRVENLTAWAYRVAYYEASNYRQKRSRDHLVFDEGLSQRVAELAERTLERIDDYREALDHCLQRLSPDHRRMIQQRYGLESGKLMPLNTLAEACGRPVGSIRQTLYRVRAVLQECVRQWLQTKHETPDDA